MSVRHRGFTLVEVLVALIVTGLVVSLAYATLRGGLDIQQRLSVQEANDEALTTVRSMLRDALQAQQALAEPGAGWERRLQVRPYATDLSELIVTVTSPRGATFTVHRLLAVAPVGREGPR